MVTWKDDKMKTTLKMEDQFIYHFFLKQKPKKCLFELWPKGSNITYFSSSYLPPHQQYFIGFN